MPPALSQSSTDQPPAKHRPAWKRLLRPAYLGLLKPAYRQLLAAQPTAMFELAGLRSHFAANRFVDTPTPDDVGAVWKELPRSRCVAIARAIRTIEFRNQELMALMRQTGIERLASLVRCCGAARLLHLHARKLPAILVGWHFRTPYLMVIAALRRLGIPALILGWPPKEISSGFEVCSPSGDSIERARVLKRVLEHLRGGGFVYTALDGPVGDGTTCQVPFMGGQLTLRRGAAVLARLSGADVIPISQRWEARGRAVTVTVHDAIPRPDCSSRAAIAFDNAILSGAVRWVESHTRAFPEERWYDLQTQKNGKAPSGG